MFMYFQTLNLDIIFVQETHSDMTIEQMWTAEWDSIIYFSHGSTNSHGVATLFNQT